MDLKVRVVDEFEGEQVTPKTDPLPIWKQKCLWMDFGPEASILRKTDAKFRTQADPVWVFPQVSVNCIDQIDSAAQTFRARYTFFLNCWITAEEFDSYNRNPIEWRPSCFPMFMPYNAAVVDRIEPIINPDGTIFSLTVQRGLWCAGCFMEHCVTYSSPFNLVRFPFDIQTLEIKFEIRDNHQSWCKPRPLLKVLAEPYYGGPGDNCACFQNVWVPPQGEWKIEQGWIYGETFVPNANSWGPIFQVVVKAQRQWSYFAWHVVFIMFLLGLSTLFMFILDDIGAVLQYMAGVLVAAIAFLFTVSSKLPSLGYLTLIDKYLLSTIVFILVSALSIIVLQALTKYGLSDYSTQVRDLVMAYMFVAACAALLCGHMWFLVLCIRAFREEQMQLTLTSRKYLTTIE